MSKTDYSCMFLIDSKLYNKKILQSDSDTSFNSHYQKSQVFPGDGLLTKSVMLQPQIIIKNGLEPTQKLNKSEALKNISTQSKKMA